MYTLTSVHVEGDNLLLTVSIPLATLDQAALQLLMDLIDPVPQVNAKPARASRTRTEKA